MSNSRRPFTCYFCNQLIENETEMGHKTLCSRVLIPCPYKCGSYVERANLARHKLECTNNTRKSINFDLNQQAKVSISNTNSLDRNNGIPNSSRSKLQDDVAKLHRRFSELEARIASSLNARNTTSTSTAANAPSGALEDVKTTLKQHSLSIQKANYFNGFMSEWKKNIDAQISSLKNSLTTIDNLKKDSAKQWTYIQEKLAQFQNLQIDLNVLKETVYKDNTHFKRSEMDLARNLEEIRGVFNEQILSFENMWREHSGVVQDVIRDVQAVRQAFDEQKAKYAGIVFDVRSVNQISSEAAEKVEILEREFAAMRLEISQLKVNMEMLDELGSTSNTTYKRLIWRITEVESKLKRSKESDIVLKSPIFYTHEYGYKIRVLLYLNGLKKWKDRYALACIHVLKGEYDPLLKWPCAIEGHITFRDQVDKSQPKNFSKFIKSKRAKGDEDEDEPQESAPTYIFIPHTVLFKGNLVKDDVLFLDVNINDSHSKYETSL